MKWCWQKVFIYKTSFLVLIGQDELILDHLLEDPDIPNGNIQFEENELSLITENNGCLEDYCFKRSEKKRF